MAYNWAQLAFVEKWRRHAVRGQIVGMHRPADRTFFELRLRPGEGNVSSLHATTDVHLQDAGDIIREKRIGLLEKASVVIRVEASVTTSGDERAGAQHSKRLIEPGGVLSGTVVALEEDIAVLDAGFPVMVQFAEPISGVSVGQPLRLSVGGTPKGFLVV